MRRIAEIALKLFQDKSPATNLKKAGEFLEWKKNKIVSEKEETRKSTAFQSVASVKKQVSRALEEPKEAKIL